MVTLSCVTCGEPFDVHPYRAKKARWCPACNQARRAGVSLICAYCRKPFTRRPHGGRTDEGAYCSTACYWAVGQVVTVCACCGQPLLAQRHRVELNKTGVYCCWACKCAKHPGKPGNPIPVECEACGRKFKRGRARYFPGRQFCNARCKGDWMRAHRNGEGHPSWEGGGIYYYGPNWDAQRDAARARDGYRCQNPACGLAEADHPVQLHVHHRRPFRSFGYKPGKNTLYLVANALENLVSLCSSCHVMAEFGTIDV